MCSAACASSRFLPSEAYGGSVPTTPIPACMSYWISWALITGCTHGLQVRASSERLEGRRLKKNQRTPPARGAKWWFEHLVLLVAPRGYSLPPRIVTTGGDTQQTTHDGDGVTGLLTLHKPKHSYRVRSVSLAKKAAAFFRISRSARRIFTSRRSRCSSSRSCVVKPSRSPASISACRTHLRSDSKVSLPRSSGHPI